MEWFRSNLPNARGLLIVPTLIKGGFVVGGSGGSAVLLVRDPAVAGGWSQPALYTIGSVTLGLQIGGEAAEVIMMIRTQGAVDRLLQSSFKLGADSSIAVGPAGVGGKANVMADILSFSRTKGAYAGLSLEGAVVATRDKLNAAYYGRPVTPVDIVVTRAVSNDHSAELRRSAAAIAQ
jgi:lipid-binding SYLF domain-containing protein